ncbi:MAG: type II toxin-antitoxin system RelE/ParE family toxin [Betaproteobacteria bacterium]|nr:type II toxin-antitoxin system RelE/ParE family toxin [Betaproteobacteria bacterium]
MTVIDYAPRALADLERVGDFLSADDPGAAARTASLVTHAIEVLRQHPLIGRLAEAGSRELVISRGRSGYLALYDYDEATDRVTVLGIRHQREAGYHSP